MEGEGSHTGRATEIMVTSMAQTRAKASLKRMVDLGRVMGGWGSWEGSEVFSTSSEVGIVTG